jgi:DnaJ-class molecular chaperone
MPFNRLDFEEEQEADQIRSTNKFLGIDENPIEVTCSVCNGSGEEKLYGMQGVENCYHGIKTITCRRCNGIGTMPVFERRY